MQVRLLSICIISFTFMACSTNTIIDFDNAATLHNADKYLAFVGEKIQLVEFDPAEDDPKPSEDADGDTIIIHMDSAFKARYRILELVHGRYDDETVDFKAYDHYGVPPFAKHDFAMLYLSEHEGALYHVKYQFDVVHPTADGRFAACGDPYFYHTDEDKIDRRPLQSITFSPPVIFKISDELIDPEDYSDYTEEEIAENHAEVKAYFSESNFTIEGDRAICKKGVYPQELFRIMAETVLLPERRQEHCTAELDINYFARSGTEERKALDACIDEMKERGLP